MLQSVEANKVEEDLGAGEKEREKWLDFGSERAIVTATVISKLSHSLRERESCESFPFFVNEEERGLRVFLRIFFPIIIRR